MTTFEELISEARRQGARDITWHCPLDEFETDPRRVGRWRCEARVRKGAATSNLFVEGRGRTGEEALRAMIEAMRGP